MIRWLVVVAAVFLTSAMDVLARSVVIPVTPLNKTFGIPLRRPSSAGTQSLRASPLSEPERMRLQNRLSNRKDVFGVRGLDGWTLYNAVVNLDNDQMIVYSGHISIGNPLQTFRVVFDTGSADIWVLSNATQTKYDVFNYYRSRSSSTYAPDGTVWNIEYGDGQSKASGWLSRDDVNVGGLVARGQIFAESVTVSQHFEKNDNQQPFDGIVGLAYNTVSESRSNTVVDTLKEQEQISVKAFSFVLTRGSNQAGSKLILGEPDLSYAAKGFTYLEAFAESGMWIVKMDAVVINDAMITGMCGIDSTCVALIDTATTDLGIPAIQWKRMTGAIIANRPDCVVDNNDQILCSLLTHERLPDLAFRLKGRDFRVSAADYMLGNRIAVLKLKTAHTNGVDLFILGVTFIKSSYTVFDMESNRIGFANPKDTPILTTTLILIMIACIVVGILGAMLCVHIRHRCRGLYPIIPRLLSAVGRGPSPANSSPVDPLVPNNAVGSSGGGGPGGAGSGGGANVSVHNGSGPVVGGARESKGSGAGSIPSIHSGGSAGADPLMERSRSGSASVGAGGHHSTHSAHSTHSTHSVRSQSSSDHGISGAIGAVLTRLGDTVTAIAPPSNHSESSTPPQPARSDVAVSTTAVAATSAVIVSIADSPLPPVQSTVGTIVIAPPPTSSSSRIATDHPTDGNNTPDFRLLPPPKDSSNITMTRE